MSFLNRHPYYKNLIKVVGYIFVIWNTVSILALGPVIGLFVIAAALGSNATSAPIAEYMDVKGSGTNQLLSVKVSGVIMGDSSDIPSPFGGLDGIAYGYDIKDKLYAAADDDLIKGVILEINSPGGTIYGSRAIADGVKYYKETTKRPVYAFISGLGASGGYWAAVSADKIFADPGSDIGSIGVMMGPFKYYNRPLSETGSLFEGGIVTQGGIEAVTLTAGKSKDAGNPYRKLTPEEINQMQLEVNNDYDTFVSYIASRRNLTEAVIRGQIGAMAYGTKSALALKLIDAAGNREDAYQALAKSAKVESDYRVVREITPTTFIGSLLGVIGLKPERQATSTDNQATAKALCSLTQAKLAYSGSTANLCPE